MSLSDNEKKGLWIRHFAHFLESLKTYDELLIFIDNVSPENLRSMIQERIRNEDLTAKSFIDRKSASVQELLAEIEAMKK